MTRARDLARIANSNALTIDSSGNVGIGSTVPTSKLSVVGIVSASQVFAGGVNLASVASGSITPTSIVVSSGSTFTNGPVLIGSGTSTGTASQPLQVSGGAYVSGKIGIGTTNPSAVLDVIGDVKVLGVSTFTNTNNAAIQIRSGATGSYTGLGVGRVAAEGLFAIASGSGQFSVNAVAGDLVLRTESASAKLFLLNGSGSSALAVAGNNILIGTGTSTGTALQPLQVNGGAYVSGSVGIGTTTPSSKLYVQGNAASNIVGLGSTTATTTLDFSQGNNFSLTLGATITIANPTGVTTGQSGVIFIQENGTGAYTVGWGTSWDFASATAPTLITTANALNALPYFARSTTSIVVGSVISGIGTL